MSEGLPTIISSTHSPLGKTSHAGEITVGSCMEADSEMSRMRLPAVSNCADPPRRLCIHMQKTRTHLDNDVSFLRGEHTGIYGRE